MNGGKRGHYGRQGSQEPRRSVAGFLWSLSTLRQLVGTGTKHDGF